jgi:hypothetical protein
MVVMRVETPSGSKTHRVGTVDDAVASGALGLEGDRAVVERFVGLFPMPEPAALPV